MLSAAGYTAAQQQRLVDIYALESMAHTDAPRAETHGRTLCLAICRLSGVPSTRSASRPHSR